MTILFALSIFKIVEIRGLEADKVCAYSNTKGKGEDKVEFKS